MRARVPKCMAVLALFAMFLCMPAATRADEVTLSHLIVESDWSIVWKAIDVEPLARFCGDVDGCEIVVRLERLLVVEARTTTARLFLNAGAPNRWFSNNTAGVYYVDGDTNNVHQVFNLAANGAFCIMDDGDADNSGLDSAPGFKLAVLGGAPNAATCTIIVKD